MKKTDLEQVKGHFDLYTNGEYVVLTGPKLYIFHSDGRLAACRADLRQAGRITFLSENRMLLCSHKAVFHMVSLKDGTDLWTAPYTKTEFNTAPLALSPDGRFAYTHDEWKGVPFISRLDLQARETAVFEMTGDIGATRDILCREDGVPCLLKTLRETVGGQEVYQNGVRIHDFDGIAPGNSTTWETKWTSKCSRHALGFLGSTGRIVTSDLHLYEPSTVAIQDLLEHGPSRPEGPPSRCWTDNSGRYLCLQYPGTNVIVDLSTHRIAARYAAPHARGCLVDGAYWICGEDRVCRRPFPAMEDAPPRSAAGGFDEHFAGHPERW